MSSVNYNKHFLVVFSPKEPKNYHNRKRFLVSANSLHNYIPVMYAKRFLNDAFLSWETKCTFRLRTFGKIEIYSK